MCFVERGSNGPKQHLHRHSSQGCQVRAHRTRLPQCLLRRTEHELRIAAGILQRGRQVHFAHWKAR
ncbi:MAG: hypothetical protein ACK4ZJ_18385, partial [Allorhizobium sp.]